MDVRQIEFFVAVAEELNFTRAAEIMYVTQSGLSSSIRVLERELRTQLFDRTPRTVTLTPAGHAFLPRARRMLRDAHAAQRELAAGPDEVSGVLGVGTEQCLGDLVDLPDLLATFQERFPGISVRFEWAVHSVTTADSGPPARLLAKMMFSTEAMAEMRKGIGGATEGRSSALVD